MQLEFINKLDAGHFADVWLARDKLMGREVAVKLFRVDDPFVDTALEHARALARVTHPNVVTVHTFLELEHPESGAHTQAIVMEYVQGQTLDALLTSGGASAQRLAQVGADLLDGLEQIHAAGLAHRDLHPRNVLVPERGPAKIIDILYLGTFQQLSTCTVEEALRLDRNALRTLLSSLIRAGSGDDVALIRADFDAPFDDLREALADGLTPAPPATALTATPTPAPAPEVVGAAPAVPPHQRAIAAIRNNEHDRQLTVRAYFEHLAQELEGHGPDNPLELTRVEASLAATVPALLDFDAFSRILAVLSEPALVRDAMRHLFAPLAAGYYLPKGYSGRFSDQQFAYHRALGKELFASFAAAFLREGDHESLRVLLGAPLELDTPPSGFREAANDFAYLGAGKLTGGTYPTTHYTGERWHSPLGSFWHERHGAKGPLPSPGFDELAAAELLLYLRSSSTRRLPLAWWPSTALFVQDTPAFLRPDLPEAQARQLCATLDISDSSDPRKALDARLFKAINALRQQPGYHMVLADRVPMS